MPSRAAGAIEVTGLPDQPGELVRERRQADQIDQVVLAHRLEPPLRDQIVLIVHPRPEHRGNLGGVDVATAMQPQEILLERRQPTVAAASFVQPASGVQKVCVVGIEHAIAQPVTPRSSPQERQIEARTVEADERLGHQLAQGPEHVREQLGLAPSRARVHCATMSRPASYQARPTMNGTAAPPSPVVSVSRNTARVPCPAPRHTRSPAKRGAVGSSRRSRQPPSNEGRSRIRAPNPCGPPGASASEIASSRRTNPTLDDTGVGLVCGTAGAGVGSVA
jgi:hypothetical protein